MKARTLYWITSMGLSTMLASCMGAFVTGRADVSPRPGAADSGNGHSTAITQLASSQNEVRSGSPESGSQAIEMPLIPCQPLPLDYLSSVADPDFAPRWDLHFWGYSVSAPYPDVTFAAEYFPLVDEVVVEGKTIYPETVCPRHTLPSADPFLDIVDYIVEHSDFFFNYEEYTVGYHDMHEQFSLSTDTDDDAYCIWKCKVPNGQTPPEVEHVINAIITDLMMVDLPPNRVPLCNLKDVDDCETEYGTPVSVTFDATKTFDPDFDALTFAWDFDGDDVYGENPDDNYSGQPDNPTHIYNLPVGEHYMTVSMKVTDPDDAESICETSFTITVEMTEAR
jgi:hypothetical protein